MSEPTKQSVTAAEALRLALEALQACQHANRMTGLPDTTMEAERRLDEIRKAGQLMRSAITAVSAALASASPAHPATAARPGREFYEALLSPENLAAEDAAGGVLAAGGLAASPAAAGQPVILGTALNTVEVLARLGFTTSTDVNAADMLRRMGELRMLVIDAAAPAQAAQPPAVHRFLCRAWGETDLPAAAICADMAAVRQFLIDEWLGDEASPDADGKPILPGVMEELASYNWADEGNVWQTEFEIGGLSIERVYVSGAAAPPPAGVPR